jgi:polyribonucleotide nucleotidyltransferase
MTYGRRLNLLDLWDNGAYRRAINILFRRSNELSVRVIDVTGMRNLLPYQGHDQPLRAKVVSITDNDVFVALPDGMEVRVPKHEVTYDRHAELREHVTSGQEVDVRVKKVDLEQGQATISMLDPKNNPLRNYTKDQIVQGIVSEFMSDGSAAFVELEPGVDGFLYKDEISQQVVKDARELLAEGQQITARITELKIDERRLRLTVRGLYQEQLSIPASHRGMVIGRGGSVIQEIMRETNTYINLDSDDGRCLIEGATQQAVEAAVQRVQVILARRIVTFTIEDRQIGMLKGKEGSTIRKIEQSHQAQIDVDRTEVTVIAPNELMLGRVLDSIRIAIYYCEVTMNVASSNIGRVIGSGGSNIRTVRSQTNTWIDIAKDNSGRIKVEGKSRADAEQAARLIQDYARSATPFTTREAPIPSKLIPRRQLVLATKVMDQLMRKQGGFFAMILGRRKSTIDKIQAATNTQISANASTGTIIIIGLSCEIVEHAIQAINTAVEELST